MSFVLTKKVTPRSSSTVESKEEKKELIPVPLVRTDRDEEAEVEILVNPTLKSITLGLGKPTAGKDGKKQWMVPISYAANLATNGGGLVAASVTISSVAAASVFTSLATIFDEFFVESAETFYQPMTRYQTLPSTTSTEFNGTALGLASLYVDSVAYTNINQMVANPSFKFVHSSSPWKYTWRNNVKRSSAVSEEPDSSHPSCAWVRTNATPAQYYGGYVNIIGSASSTMHASTTLGVLAVRFNTWFRAKS